MPLPFRSRVSSLSSALVLVMLAGCSTTDGDVVSPPDEDGGTDTLVDFDTATDSGADATEDSFDATKVDTGADVTADTTAVETAGADVTGEDGFDSSGLDVSPSDALPDTTPSTCTDGGDAAPADAGTPLGAVLEKTGVAGKVLLKGMVVTPDTAFAGEVLVEGDIITCVAASCAASAGSATASVVQTNGIILPGMIDAHNHILFDIMDETDWSPTKSYMNHNQWTAEPRYSAMVDAKQYLNGEAGSTADLGCEMDKYGELKGLVAGTTSIVGAANPTNRACYGTLARTIDQTPNGLGADKIQVATLFPATSAADGVCGNFTDGSTDAYLIHIAEGVDATALAEFTKLGTITTTDNCLYNPKTTIVHGTALGTTELTTMATNSMGLVWSPRSNVFLYGAGIDLTKTTNIPFAISKGINVSIAPDWSMGGSQNMLDELRFADKVDNTAWGNILTTKMLVQMATSNAAKNLGLSAKLGSIAVGLKADLMVISGDPAAPYDAVLAARPRDVQLVMVGGVALVGALPLQPIAPSSPACETLDVCCATKFICVAAPGGTTTNKFGQTFAEIQTALSTGLSSYDALGLTTYKFAPLTPVVRCE